MSDWSPLLLLAGLVAVPVLVVAMLELRASRRRREGVSPPSGRPPAEPGWSETLGADRGRAFAFDEVLHQADKWQPPGPGVG